MRARGLVAVLFGMAAFGTPAYFTDDFWSWNGGSWRANGTISAGGHLLTSADGVGGTAVSLVTPATGRYEIVARLRLAQSGGRFTILARASADAQYGSALAGSFYAVDFSNVVVAGGNASADMKVVKRVGGVVTLITQWPVGLRDGALIQGGSGFWCGRAGRRGFWFR